MPTTDTDLLLVRHGQSEWNAEGRWQGQADPALTKLGERQAFDATAHLGAVDAIWSSDLQRAARTAEIMAEVLGIDAVADARFRERHAGEWQGLTRAEIEAGWPGYLGRGERPAGWEADDEVIERALDGCRTVANALPGARVVVVTHGGIVRALERLLGAPDDGLHPNLGGRWFVATDGSLVVKDRVVLVDDREVTTPDQI